MEKLKVVGNLKSKDTETILESFKNPTNPILYVDDGFGDKSFKENV